MILKIYERGGGQRPQKLKAVFAEIITDADGKTALVCKIRGEYKTMFLHHGQFITLSDDDD
jgi:hypothetical protein